MNAGSEFAERLKEVRRQLAEPVALTPAEDGEAEYQAHTCGRMGNRPQISVTFAKKDGRGKTFAYSHLYCLHVEENVNLGFAVEFTRHRVTVKGRNLRELARLIGDHKVRDVQETDELHALALPPDAAVVTCVEITDTKDCELT